jgi:NADPH:quinone reductase-like Zn-dependent oxidoreductase
MGTDVAGTIVQLGPGVTRFEIGQRVIGHCDSLLTQKPSRSGYQHYTICREILVAAVPKGLALSHAVVLPLAISTAATGLYKHLKLPLPSLEPTPTGKTVLIWGGSSSVGSTAIQLAVASGYTVATTAGAHNHAYVKSLGATHVVDYNNPNIVEEAINTLKTGDVVLDTIGEPGVKKSCAAIIRNIGECGACAR